MLKSLKNAQGACILDAHGRSVTPSIPVAPSPTQMVRARIPGPWVCPLLTPRYPQSTAKWENLPKFSPSAPSFRFPASPLPRAFLHSPFASASLPSLSPMNPACRTKTRNEPAKSKFFPTGRRKDGSMGLPINLGAHTGLPTFLNARCVPGTV